MDDADRGSAEGKGRLIAMSDHPWRHHFLPEWYLKHWARNGRVWAFSRPRGIGFPVVAKPYAPRAIGFDENLYTDPRENDPDKRVELETRFFKQVDDRAARAFRLALANRPAEFADKVALVQFILGLLHRSPARIAFLERELARRLEEDDAPVGFDAAWLRSSALKVLSDISTSDQSLALMAQMKVFVHALGRGAHDLITSDKPALLSNGMEQSNAFILMPIGPTKLMALVHREGVARRFFDQKPRDLSRSINAALLAQAEGLVIGNRVSELSFVEKHFLTGHDDEDSRGRLDGLMRWQLP